MLAPSDVVDIPFKSFNSLDFLLFAFGEPVTFVSIFGGLLVCDNAELSAISFVFWVIVFDFWLSDFTDPSSDLCDDNFVCEVVLIGIPSDSFEPLFTGVFFSSTLFCNCGHNAKVTFIHPYSYINIFYVLYLHAV